MIWTSATTGKHLQGVEHLRQSIRDILTTPVGTRVMRRDYGSRLFELTDMPFNRSTALDFVAATVDALARWEPRFRVTKVVPTADAEGRFSISVQGQYLPDGVEIFIDGIVVK